jgi:hypothetical protein
LDLQWVLMEQERSPPNKMKLPNSSQVLSSTGCPKFAVLQTKLVNLRI